LTVDLSVEIGGLKMKNPVMTASGTFGYGREYAHVVDLNRLGALVVKGTSVHPWAGNPPPRVAETPAGMLNAIGLENPGVDRVVKEELPALRAFHVPVVVNIVGHTVSEYVEVARRLDDSDGVAALEVNISCPNVAEGGLTFGTDPDQAFEVLRRVREVTRLPLIAKLTPNVTSVAEIARSVVEAGADAVSLINTLLGMSIDIETRRPVLGNTLGGLSGPAVKPVALRMVWEVAGAVSVPVIGMGGICNARDALEFLMAGASAVAVGTATFVDPTAPLKIVDGIEKYLKEKGFRKVTEVVGLARRS